MALLKGFRQSSISDYGIKDASELSSYMSFLERERAWKVFNKQVRPVLNHKRYFPDILPEFRSEICQNLFEIYGGRLTKLSIQPSEWPLDIVVKPVLGLRSRGVQFVEFRDGGFIVDGVPLSIEEFALSCDKETMFIGTPRVQLHSEIARLCPEANHSIRMLTYRDPSSGKSRIARSIMRIGSVKSAPLEVFIFGGLVSEIDLVTGRLSPGILGAHTKSAVTLLEAHPDSGVEFASVITPHWDQIKNKVCEICDRNPAFEFIGWDIMIDQNGIKILEANTTPGIEALQFHNPLFENRDFLDAMVTYGIARRSGSKALLH